MPVTNRALGTLLESPSPLADEPTTIASTLTIVKPRQVGRYLVYERIGSGGTSAVHIGCTADGGERKLVAIKLLDRRAAWRRTALAMFLDEARLGARVHHPNVVKTLDLVTDPIHCDIALITEYIYGETLASLVSRGLPDHGVEAVGLAAGIAMGMLRGLEAVHEARTIDERPLGLVHCDVSPQNILVGADGQPRLIDFGIAFSIMQDRPRDEGRVRGKPPYMAPEQIRGEPLDRRTDIFSAGVVLWELLTGRRLFRGDSTRSIWTKVLQERIPAPSRLNPAVPAALDAVVMCAMDRAPGRRFPTAGTFVDALARAVPSAASPRRIASWVDWLAGDRLADRATRAAEIRAESMVPSADPGEGMASKTRAPVAEPARPIEGTLPVRALEIRAPVRSPQTATRERPLRVAIRRRHSFAIVSVLGVAGALTLGHVIASVGRARAVRRTAEAIAAEAPNVAPATSQEPAAAVPDAPAPPAAAVPPVLDPVAGVVPGAPELAAAGDAIGAGAPPDEDPSAPPVATRPVAAPRRLARLIAAPRLPAPTRAALVGRIAELNRKAERAHDGRHYAEARRLLAGALAIATKARLEREPETARAHAQLAVVLAIGYRDPARARKQLRAALLVPEYSPPPALLSDSRVLEIYQKAVASLEPGG